MAVTIEEAHAFARERGTSKLVYGTARVVLTADREGLCFRFKVTGAEYVPAEGGAIIAPNHKSMYDPFFIGLATKRPLHFMSKDALFEGRTRAPAARPRRVPRDPRHRRPRGAGDLAHPPRGRPRARALPRGHPRPRSGHAARPAPRRRPARARDAGPDRPVRDHRHRPAVQARVPAPEGPGLLRPRDRARPARGHARGGRRPDREPGLARGRARVPPPAHQAGADRRRRSPRCRRGGGIAYKATRKPKKRELPKRKLKQARKKLKR